MVTGEAVLQHQHPKRLRGNSPPDTLRNIAGKAQCSVPARQSYDQLLFNANRRHSRRLHSQGILDCICSYDEHFVYGIVLFQQVTNVGYGDIGRVGEGFQQVLRDSLQQKGQCATA